MQQQSPQPFSDTQRAQLDAFITRLNNVQDSIEFADTMAVIEALYEFSPSAFANGSANNLAGQNNGSCKILAFGQLNGLNEAQTLKCFGQFYRVDVLENPQGDDHQNIRQFMAHGWPKVVFEEKPLKVKVTN